MSGVARLIAARVRRRPGPWLLPALGIALTVAFAGAVLVAATVAGDQTARRALSALAPVDRAVRIGYTGDVTPAVSARATAALRSLGLPLATDVVLLNPVRLDGRLVRPAAIDPLGRWSSAAAPGPCRATACPMLLAGGRLPRTRLSASGVRLTVTGVTRLRSTAPLGYVPSPASGDPPLLLTGDADGLDRLAGLSGVYRSRGWVALFDPRRLHAWDLPGLERRLQSVSANLIDGSPLFTFDGPAAALARAHAQAGLAPRRLFLAGGGAIAALLLFLVLAAGGLRRDQFRERARLKVAGARTGQSLGFVAGEAALLCAAAAVVGALLAVEVGVVLAGGANLPVGGILTHSVLRPAAIAGLVVGWGLASALLAVLLAAPAGRAADGAALAAVAVLAVALVQGADQRGAVTLALVPCGCLAVGVLVFRAGARLLRAGERIVRGGPVLVRLALAGLSRAPETPALTAAFIAVSTGLGGFALVYRATLQRGSADQAAQEIPLDATVTPGADFRPALELAPLPAWQRLAGGPVLPVRRTQATLASGGATATVPALGVPAAGLGLIHGWRSGELPAPPSVLAVKLTAGGPPRTPGPALPDGTVSLAVPVSSRPALSVTATAELRDPAGDVRAVPLSAGRGNVQRGPVPPGKWELQALEFAEPSGLLATNGHQNAENPAASTQATVEVAAGPVTAFGAGGRRLEVTSLASWQGAGALSAGPGARLRFSESGQPGVLRPRQPSDTVPLPVLVDRGTAAVAGRGRRLALTVDGLPVIAHVVGVLPRFPTVAPGAGGFVVADGARLAGALEAQLPGQGRPDELWLDTRDPARVRSALRTSPLNALLVAFRSDREAALSHSPIARGVLGTLLGAAALAAALAVVGLLVALAGALRDERYEADLRAQGLGPRGLHTELRLRLAALATLGVAAGVVTTALLARLAVVAVRAAGAVADPQPPLVTVAPLGLLALAAVGAILVLSAAGWVATSARSGAR